MLRELSVQNLALIEDVSVQLRPGYCVWTGETGAGKSLLLTAFELVLGGKASTDLIRSGRTEARVSAVFACSDPSLRTSLGTVLNTEIDDEDVILSRRIFMDRPSSAQVNGVPITVRTLRALGALLVDLHGQDDAGSILDCDQQCLWLDAWSDLVPARLEFQARRRAYSGLIRARDRLIRNSKDRERERALLEFERDELVGLDPKVGEHDSLACESARLGQAERIRSVASEAYFLLYEADNSAQGRLAKAAKQIEALGGVDPELAEAAKELDRLACETREVAYTLRQVSQGSLNVEKRLDAIESRLDHYRKLTKRLRSEPDGLAERLKFTEEKLSQIDQGESELKALVGPLTAAWAEVGAVANQLSIARSTGAKGLTHAVQTRLKGLGLSQAQVDLEVGTTPLGDHELKGTIPLLGLDRVEWMFTPNPGEPARPLREIASGGERSRVTLAIKAALAGRRVIPTLVFDEIDTGVGGRLGSALGKTLKELAQHHQVLCITHLPQLASHADHHWAIRKSTSKGLTRTTIHPLSPEERIREVAAMIRGESASETTRLEAEAMIAEAQPKLGESIH